MKSSKECKASSNVVHELIDVGVMAELANVTQERDVRAHAPFIRFLAMRWELVDIRPGVIDQVFLDFRNLIEENAAPPDDVHLLTADCNSWATEAVSFNASTPIVV